MTQYPLPSVANLVDIVAADLGLFVAYAADDAVHALARSKAIGKMPKGDLSESSEAGRACLSRTIFASIGHQINRYLWLAELSSRAPGRVQSHLARRADGIVGAGRKRVWSTQFGRVLVGSS
jgi:hypothetical protein